MNEGDRNVVEKPQFILTRTVAQKALRERVIGADDARQLEELQLLRKSTASRSSLFPGEKFLLPYNFHDGKEEHVGFLGLDSELNLLSIDERSPESKCLYRQASRDSQSSEVVKTWVDITPKV